MKRTIALSLLTLVAAVALAAVVQKTSAVAFQKGPSANGQGMLTLPDGRKRQFSFSARQNADGTVTGHAVIHNPDFDFRSHIDITCLQVVGNRANLGGTVRSTNDPFFDGQNGFFTVIDNGEPGKGTDTISLVFFDAQAPPSSCQLIGPNDFDQMPISNGNIQVRP